jgi:hypothetical protein
VGRFQAAFRWPAVAHGTNLIPGHLQPNGYDGGKKHDAVEPSQPGISTVIRRPPSRRDGSNGREQREGRFGDPSVH